MRVCFIAGMRRDREAARKLFEIVRETGGEEVTGAGVTFDPRAFWDGFVL